MRRIALYGAGFGILAFLINRFGWENLWSQLMALGWGFPVLVLLGGFKILFRAWSWSIALRSEGIHLSLLSVVGVRLSSQAIGYLSSMTAVVSEATGTVLLRNKGDLATIASASLTETLNYWGTGCVLGLAGSLTGAALMFPNYAISLPLLGAAAIFGTALYALRMKWQVIPRLVSLGARFLPAESKVVRWLGIAEPVERRMRIFRQHHGAAARSMFLLGLAVQLVMVGEVALVIMLLGASTSIFAVLAFEAMSRVFKIVSSPIPGRIGADEAASATLFAMFGLPGSAGFALAIARRMQAIVWVGIGLTWLAVSGWKGSREETSYADSAVLTRT